MGLRLRPSHLVLLAAGSLALSAAEGRGDDPRAIPTFHCLGLYWSPAGRVGGQGSPGPLSSTGRPGWKPALSMRHNPIPGTDEDLADYRGSIVHLAPATTYEVELTLAGTTTTATPDRDDLERGLPRRRDGPGGRPRHAPGDHRVGHAGRLARLRRPGRDHRRAPPARPVHHDRRLLRDPPRLHAQGGRRRPATLPGRRSAPSGSTGGHDIVIEDCDISDWGRLDPATGFGFDIRLGHLLAQPPGWNGSSSSAASCTIPPGTAAPGTSRSIPRTRRGRRPSPCSTRRATT